MTVLALAACASSASSNWGPAGSDTGAGSTTPEAGDSSGGVDSAAGGSSDAGARDAPGETGGRAGDGGSEGGGVVVPALKAVMYLPNWNGSFSSWATQINFNKMTHLLLAFGLVDTSNNWNLGAADSDVRTLAAAAHAHNVKILVSIGGMSGDTGIITQYQTASNIAPMVSHLDAFVSRLNLDGVDVDLEQGNLMTSGSNYPAFVSHLISTFHPEGRLVTSALAQYIVQDAKPDATITSTVTSFDFINDMIYSANLSDYTNEASWWTGTIGLAKDKLTLGIQFTGNLSVGTAQQITADSQAYGGVMCWEYSAPSEAQLWPAIQSSL
jgi:hypothetical protein